MLKLDDDNNGVIFLSFMDAQQSQQFTEPTVKYRKGKQKESLRH